MDDPRNGPTRTQRNLRRRTDLMELPNVVESGRYCILPKLTAPIEWCIPQRGVLHYSQDLLQRWYHTIEIYSGTIQVRPGPSSGAFTYDTTCTPADTNKLLGRLLAIQLHSRSALKNEVHRPSQAI